MAWHVAAAALLLAASLAGCTTDNSAGMGGGKSVSNNPGSFSYSAGGVLSASDSYDWQNPSATARVSFSAGGTGTVSITIQDAAGKQVFTRSFSGSGGSSDNVPTSPGLPGMWKIRISTQGAGGFSLSVRSG